MKRNFDHLAWREVTFMRPFEIAAVYELLTNLATLSPCGFMVWEVRGQAGKVRYLLGMDRRFMHTIEKVFKTHLEVQFSKASSRRKPVTAARRVKVTRPTLSLKTDNALAVTRAVLATLAQAGADEEVVLQIILGSSHAPAPAPSNPADPHASWLEVLRGTVPVASGDVKTAISNKVSCHGFNAIVRVGAYRKDGKVTIAGHHLYGLVSALRTLESAGVRLVGSPENPTRLNRCAIPWSLPQRFSVRELASLFLLPIGDAELAGVGGLHPQLLPAPDWLRVPSSAQSRTFGLTLDSKAVPLNISPRDSLEHTILMGPTGAGKSTAMLHLILADIKAGRSVLVIDPKADLVNDVLARIPDNRIDDVIVLDPSDSNPVGFNPLSVSPRQNPNLVADAVLAVLKAIFSDSWGIRTQDILTGTLLSLAQTKGASLVMLPALLTNEAFRRKVVSGLNDTIGLLPFWAGYEAMKAGERNQAIAPVLNKLRQFILRPELRGVLGQAEPKFMLADLFDKRRIVLVPLNKGIVGAENARLLGSLIVGLTWTLALSRANLPPERRYLVSVFIDELQDYLALPTNLSDALSQARSLGVGITMAHQYRTQLTPDIRAGIDANARNKVIFGLNATDARDMAQQAPELTGEDFMRLPRFGVYASLQVNGKSTGWLSGKTHPMPPVVREATELRALSQTRYGKDLAEVEQEYLAAIGYSDTRRVAQDIRDGVNGNGGSSNSNSNGKAKNKTQGGSHAIGRKLRAK
jgi:hypothetical protein